MKEKRRFNITKGRRPIRKDRCYLMNILSYTVAVSHVAVNQVKTLARIGHGSQNSFCVRPRDPKLRCKKGLVLPQPVNGNYSHSTATIWDPRTPSSPLLPGDKRASLPPFPISLETLLCAHITAEPWRQRVLPSRWHAGWPRVSVEALQVPRGTVRLPGPRPPTLSRCGISAPARSGSHEDHASQWG